MTFFGRELELAYFDKVLKAARKSPQIVVVYGRRRVGKTTLVNEFIRRRKRGINFFVEPKDGQLLLADLEEEIMDLGVQRRPVFKTFDDFFEYLFEYLGRNGDPMVFSFDEVQNFNRSVPGFFVKLQKYWDKYQADSRIMLVCIGSLVGMMKKTFQDKKEPMFGRAQHFINLRRFDFWETREMLRVYGGVKDDDEAVYLFGILDGIPKYLQYVQGFYDGDLYRFIDDVFVSELAPLKEEGKFILVQEFGSDHSGYFSLLECISRGKRIPVEMSHKTSIHLSTVGKYLHDLTTYYEIVERRYPVTEDPFKSRNVRYFLGDNFYRFWFSMVYQRKSLDRIRSELDSFMGPVFEDLCIQYTKRHLGYEHVGRWWKRDNEIDIVGLEKGMPPLVGECKWSKNKVNVDTYLALRHKFTPFQAAEKNNVTMRYALFSRSGFTKRMKSLAAKEDVLLVDLKDICKV